MKATNEQIAEKCAQEIVNGNEIDWTGHFVDLKKEVKRFVTSAIIEATAPLEQEVEQLRLAENLVSKAYLRVRELVKAWDTNYGGENRFEVTENCIKQLQHRLDEAERACAEMRALIISCQLDLSEWIVPDSGITESGVIEKLLYRLDGPESRSALNSSTFGKDYVRKDEAERDKERLAECVELLRQNIYPASSTHLTYVAAKDFLQEFDRSNDLNSAMNKEKDKHEKVQP